MRRLNRYLSRSRLRLEAGNLQPPAVQPATEPTTQPTTNQRKIDKVSDVFSTYLGDLWNYLLKVKYEDDQKLALIDLKNLGIRHETLELDGASHTYFCPMDPKTFQAYTIDTKSVSAQEIVDRSSRPWNEKVLKSMYGDEGNEDVAQQLCSMLQDNFQRLSMKEGQDGEPIYFQEMTDWKEVYVITLSLKALSVF